MYGAKGDEDGYVMQRSQCPEKKSESAVSLLEGGSLRTDLLDVTERLAEKIDVGLGNLHVTSCVPSRTVSETLRHQTGCHSPKQRRSFSTLLIWPYRTLAKGRSYLMGESVGRSITGDPVEDGLILFECPSRLRAKVPSSRSFPQNLVGCDSDRIGK